MYKLYPPPFAEGAARALKRLVDQSLSLDRVERMYDRPPHAEHLCDACVFLSLANPKTHDYAPWEMMSEGQLLELAASQCCIRDGILNIGVAHVLLHGTKVSTLVDQMNPACMA